MPGKDDNATFTGDVPTAERTLAVTLASGEVTAQAEEVTARLPPADHERMGQYVLLGKLGEGGMGLVYKAQQEHPHRLVAIKVIHTHMATPAMRARFTFEAEVLARLDHPGIARIYEAVQDGAKSWFAMEYVDGQPLDVWARTHGLDVAGKVALLARVCDAVHHAHLRGVVHRDLKPGNILVDGTGQPKILDFGIARATRQEMDPGVKHTRVGQIVGTPAYMSPEQATLGGEDLDARSDVYALGVIAWELLTGRLPHDLTGLDLSEMIRVIKEVDAPLLSRVREDVPQDVVSIVAKALQKDPADRYQSAAALADDLRHYLADEPISARRATSTQQLVRFVRRNKLTSALVAGLVCSLAFGFVATSASYVRMTAAFQDADAQRMIAESARADLEKQNASLVVARARAVLDADATEAVAFLKTVPASAAWDDVFSVAYAARGRGVAADVLGGHTDELRRVDVSADGRFVSTAAYDDTARIWDLHTHTYRVLGAHAGDVGHALFSPDGRALVTASHEGTVLLWRSQDGATFDGRSSDGSVKPLSSHVGSVEGVAWSRDGRHVATVGEDGLVQISDASGNPEATFEAGVRLQHVSWLADSSRVAASGDGGFVAVWELRSGARTDLVGHAGDVTWVEAEPAGDAVWTAGADGTVRRWQGGIGEIRARVGAETRAVAFAPDGRTATAIDREGHLLVFDDLRGPPSAPRVLTGHDGVARSLAVSPDGRTAATGGDDGRVVLWDLHTGRMHTLSGHQGRVRDVKFTPDGRFVLSASSDGTARLWSTDLGAPTRLVGHEKAVTSGAFAPGAPRLATTSEDGSVRTWDLRTGASTVFHGHTDETDDVAWTADGATRVSVGRDYGVWFDRASGAVRGAPWPDKIDRVAVSGNLAAAAARTNDLPVWDLQSSAVTALVGHTTRVGDVAWAPDGRALVSGGYDGTVRWWSRSAADALAPGHVAGTFRDAVTAVAWSPDGSRVAVASEDGHLGLYDAEGSAERRVSVGSAVRDVAWSPEGANVALAAADGTVAVVRASDLALRTLGAHDGEARAVLWLSEGTVASGGADGRVALWAADGEGAPHRFLGTAGGVRFLARSPDRTVFVAGGDGADIDVWPTTPPSGEEAVRALLDGLTRARLDDRERAVGAWSEAR